MFQLSVYVTLPGYTLCVNVMFTKHSCTLSFTRIQMTYEKAKIKPYYLGPQIQSCFPLILSYNLFGRTSFLFEEGQHNLLADAYQWSLHTFLSEPVTASWLPAPAQQKHLLLITEISSASQGGGYQT